MQPIVDKVNLDRLKDRDLHVSFLCPYCKSTRIALDSSRSADAWSGIDCPKFGAHPLPDRVSIVMIKDGVATRA